MASGEAITQSGLSHFSLYAGHWKVEIIGLIQRQIMSLKFVFSAKLITVSLIAKNYCQNDLVT